MKKVLLLAPRLDITFKRSGNTHLPKKGPITIPIRLHWQKFIECVEKEYNSRSDVEFIKEEMALWQFDQSVIDKHNPNIVLVPHKESHNFPVKNSQPYYYMQTTFPWLFSLDIKGWAGGASVYPYDTIMNFNFNNHVFNKLHILGQNNQSKFNQPKFKNIELPENFVLFACQIPYDETIKYHSDVEVGKALVYTANACEKLGLTLVVKGHPVNPDSMIGLKDSVKHMKHVKWVDNISIHQLLEKCYCVVVVNSGVGMEALLHKKPVVTFGRAEYDCVTNHADKHNIENILTNLKYDEQKVIQFFHSWYHWCYDTEEQSSFSKLP